MQIIPKTKLIYKNPKGGDPPNSKPDVPLILKIRRNIIGLNTKYISELGIDLQSVYVDHTATNRPYRPIQTMVEYAKTMAANPHTQFSFFGKYSTHIMEFSQKTLLQSFNADPQHYVALPAGSGSTGAIEKTIKVLQSIELPDGQKPAVFITPYEHHSNTLGWIEYFGNVETLAYDDKKYGLLMEQIQDQLFDCKSNYIIVSVSAASNVTSYLTDLYKLNEIIKIVRSVKFIIFAVDCAAYCCHKELDLSKLSEIDFVFLSPHKNLGGPESCGVLVARKWFFLTEKPTFPGGGTVAFVSGLRPENVVYDDNVFNRQISGTPDFLGFYRAALSFDLLKNNITYSFIQEREKTNTCHFMKMIEEHNNNFKRKQVPANIIVYGCPDFERRANVITFNVKWQEDFLHHHQVSTALADVFGIQVRSGCFCAGPFGIKLLKLTQQKIEKIKKLMNLGISREKSGYIRLDLTFYLQPYEVEYLANAIAVIAENGEQVKRVWKMNTKGEISRAFHREPTHLLGLEHIQEVENELNTTIKQEEENYNSREQTLQRQMSNGRQILRYPQLYIERLYKCHSQ